MSEDLHLYNFDGPLIDVLRDFREKELETYVQAKKRLTRHERAGMILAESGGPPQAPKEEGACRETDPVLSPEHAEASHVSEPDQD